MGPLIIAVRTGVTTIGRFLLSADGLPLTLAMLKGAHIFGGPFSGKTTLAKGLRDSEPGAEGIEIVEYDEFLKTQPNYAPKLKRAWRPDHPLHALWVEVHADALRKMATIRSNGGITIAHDPRPDTEVERTKQFCLYPSVRELSRRAEAVRNSMSAVDPEGFASRIQAADHWARKFAERGWARQYKLLTTTPTKER